jgi:hypothetical protein
LLVPECPVDEDVATMSLAARYIWTYLPCHADREGRLKDNAFTLQVQILPTEPVSVVSSALAEIASKGHIIRYSVDGKNFIQIRSFHKHQSPHPRETPSVIPECPRPALGEPRPALGEPRPALGEPSKSRNSSFPVIRDDLIRDDQGGDSLPTQGLRSEPPEGKPRIPRKQVHLGAVTPAFLRVYELYPNSSGKQRAAQEFQDAAPLYGGEEALSRLLSGILSNGFLKQHPYNGEMRFIPTLARVIGERMFEEKPKPAPSDAVYPKLTAPGASK